MIQQPLKIRIPLSLGGEEIQLLVQVSDEDARRIVAAPRKAVRDMDAGMFQTIRDVLRRFLETETEKTT